MHFSVYFSPFTKKTKALSDPTFSIWYDKGLKTFKDFYKDGIFHSFADLSSAFQLPPSHLFRYYQIRYCIKSLFPTFPTSIVGRVSLSRPPSEIFHFRYL